MYKVKLFIWSVPSKLKSIVLFIQNYCFNQSVIQFVQTHTIEFFIFLIIIIYDFI